MSSSVHVSRIPKIIWTFLTEILMCPHMFLRQIRFSNYFLNRSQNMASTINIINNRVSSIERTITTLQTEVADLKRLLRDLTESKTSNESKKRKLCDVREESQPLFNSDQIDGNFNIDGNGYVQVYTDGACENNGKKNARAGLGVWFGPNHPLNLAEPVKRRPTNNVGEIEACTRAIQQAHANGITKLCINTDSEFTINCITKWINGWKKKGWKTAAGKPVINKDELIELDNAMDLLDSIKWNHVRGHNGIAGNEAADELARRGAAMSKIE